MNEKTPEQIAYEAGTTQQFWYPTAEAADFAARGFRIRGCSV